MFKRKFMILVILFVGLLVISTASAEENATGDVVSMDDAVNVEIDDSQDDKSVKTDESDDEVLEAVDDDNLEVTGADFNFKVRRTEVDNESRTATMFSFEWPDELMWGPNRMAIIISSYKKVNVVSFFQDQTDDKVNIELKDLGIWGPGTYNYTAAFYDVFDNPSVYVASGSFIVTSNDVPVDFINITENVINDTEQVVVTIYDPLGNLTGFIYVYANNTLVYEKDSRYVNGGKGYENITVYAKDLKGEIYDGANDIKVVYKRTDNKQYTKEAVVHFTNVFGTIIPTILGASRKTIVYNQDESLYAILMDKNYTPIAGKVIFINGIGEEFYLRTDSKGEIRYPLSTLAPGKYLVSFHFEGDKTYKKSSGHAIITLKKATPIISAKSKTFKKSVKTKKYSITLKNNKKAIKNKSVTIKINKKKYTATTNSKGVATFKITKLNKKGTFKSTVTFKGNKYYNKVTKTVKIKCQ